MKEGVKNALSVICMDPMNIVLVRQLMDLRRARSTLVDEDGKIGLARIICILFSIIFASQDLQMETLWSELENF